MQSSKHTLRTPLKHGLKTPSRQKPISRSSSESSLNEPLNVFCRICPLKDENGQPCVKLMSPTSLAITTPSEFKTTTHKEIHYKFEHIFTSYATQKEVFDHVAFPLLQDLLNGKDALLFSYGVTGSGKTYTLTGEPLNPGVMPRCIYTLFNTIGEFQTPKFTIKPDKMNGFEVQSENDALQDRLLETKNSRVLKNVNRDKLQYTNDESKIIGINEDNLYTAFVSYTEIYNNVVYDLLDDSNGKTLQGKILRKDSQQNMYVNGVVEVEVKSAGEAFEVFNLGQKLKRMAHTTLNSESSRSHSIFNIRLVQLQQIAHNSDGNPVIPETNLLRMAQLSLVDLAGSERTNRTQNAGARLKEASSINNSLMTLRNCLEILRENQLTGGNRLVPYRDSRLTFLFKNYFEGNGSVRMIVCVNPSSSDYEENLHVMNFAEITQEVKLPKPDSRYATPCRKTIKKPNVNTPSTFKIKSRLCTLPKMPTFKFDIENFEKIFPALEEHSRILKLRIEKRRIADEEIIKKSEEFRKRLVTVDQSNVLMKSEIRNLNNILKKKDQELMNMRTKVADLETVNDRFSVKNDELQGVIRSLGNKIDQKDLQINQKILEKEKTKQKMVLKCEKYKQEFDAKLRKERQHIEAVCKAKDQKLKKVKDILESDFVEAQEEPEIIVAPSYEPELSPPPGQRDPTSKKTAPYVSAARHRRSRSAGEACKDVWLEHNVIKPVALGTVLQPSIKKRKSLTKLSKASDITNPKQSKYCLIAQDQDTDGELETKVYKGDIVPTCGGGAQVILNDVEILRQMSPTASPK